MSAVSYELRGATAWIGLDRPAKRNAVSAQLLADLEGATRRAHKEARAIVVFGHGPCFSAGMDLSEHRERDAQQAFAISRAWHETFGLIRRGPIPVIAAVHGAAIGGGLELACAAHIRVADETASFALPEARHGIYVGGGGSVFIAQLIGTSRMSDMMLTGRTLDAGEAERTGLVQYSVPKGEALSKAAQLAEKMADVPPLTLLGILQALPRIRTMSEEDGLFTESMMSALSQTGPEAAHRLALFGRAPGDAGQKSWCALHTIQQSRLHADSFYPEDSTIETHLHDNILEIMISNPPANALGNAVRQDLLAAVTAAQTDSAVTGIVIRGAGELFSGGADITEFGANPVDPGLPAVVDAIEASAKPVVAAIHGMALGGGLEVALGCHYRIATTTAKLGLPEVTLGLLPYAGGTQRLPRLIGAEAALEMIVLGSSISAAKAAKLGLVDKLSNDASLAADAIAFARTCGAPRRSGDLPVSSEPGLFEHFAIDNARKFGGLDAPRACIDAVRAAAELPFAEGLKKERALFGMLVEGAQSEGLRHIFFAERAAAKIDGLPKDIALRPIAKVGVIGAGTMGSGISMNFLSAHIPVTIVEMTQDALNRGTALIRKNYEASAAKGRLTADQVEKAMALLSPTLDFDALSSCDLIIEAVYENMDVKKEIFARLDGIAKSGAMLASNTSYLSIDEIAAATKRPQDVLGLHFFSPANIMKLVEVVRGAKTASDALATGMDLVRRIGKVPVVSGDCYGFIGNRMLTPRLDGAIDMLVEGSTPDKVDRASVELGMPMGPLQMIDLAGVDIGWHRDPNRIESVRDALCAAKRWGQKTQGGFYDYDEKGRPLLSPKTQAIVEQFRARANGAPRDISDEEIVTRTLYVMINEGAKILEEGIAQRASDIDVVWVHGYGWPRHTGGPMLWADKIGLSNVVDALDRYREHLGQAFSLSPLLVQCATENRPLGR